MKRSLVELMSIVLLRVISHIHMRLLINGWLWLPIVTMMRVSGFLTVVIMLLTMRLLGPLLIVLVLVRLAVIWSLLL